MVYRGRKKKCVEQKRRYFNQGQKEEKGPNLVTPGLDPQHKQPNRRVSCGAAVGLRRGVRARKLELPGLNGLEPGQPTTCGPSGASLKGLAGGTADKKRKGIV